MTPSLRRRLAKRKRSSRRRLDKAHLHDGAKAMFTASNRHSAIAGRGRGSSSGGRGALHLLARRLGLLDTIDRRLHLLKIHRPYHQSDHVRNRAYNALCQGTGLQDLERRRTGEAFLDPLGVRRLPDPTSAGDFCRRFSRADSDTLQDVLDEARLKAWAGQPEAFCDRATIDRDGTLVASSGACKQGRDIACDGTWGYHPLVLTLANSGAVLGLVHPPGNRPAHEGAAAEGDRARAVCCRGGVRRVLLRGDSDFAPTPHRDRWDDDGRVRFRFGYDATPNLVALAQSLPAAAGRPRRRPARYQVQAAPRRRPEDVKARVVRLRQFETLRLLAEEVAAFNYRPSAGGKTERLVVVRKNLSQEKGEVRLLDESRSFFFITNDGVSAADERVFCAHGRCDQENVLAQLQGGCRALRAPLDGLESNWAYLGMTALAWNRQGWWALRLPAKWGRGPGRHRSEKAWVLGLEFRTFVQAFVRRPCQVVGTGRKLV